MRVRPRDAFQVLRDFLVAYSNFRRTLRWTTCPPGYPAIEKSPRYRLFASSFPITLECFNDTVSIMDCDTTKKRRTSGVHRTPSFPRARRPFFFHRKRSRYVHASICSRTRYESRMHTRRGTRQTQRKALFFRRGCLRPARGMRLAALTHWLPAKSFFHATLPAFLSLSFFLSPSRLTPLRFNFGGNIQTAANQASTYRINSSLSLFLSLPLSALEIVSRWYPIDASGVF